MQDDRGCPPRFPVSNRWANGRSSRIPALAEQAPPAGAPNTSAVGIDRGLRRLVLVGFGIGAHADVGKLAQRLVLTHTPCRPPPPARRRRPGGPSNRPRLHGRSRPGRRRSATACSALWASCRLLHDVHSLLDVFFYGLCQTSRARPVWASRCPTPRKRVVARVGAMLRKAALASSVVASIPAPTGRRPSAPMNTLRASPHPSSAACETPSNDPAAIGQLQIQEVTDAQRIGRPPREARSESRPSKYPSRSRRKYRHRRQTRAPDPVRIERRARGLDERIERRVVQYH